MEQGLKIDQNPDFDQWKADNERLTLAGLQNDDDEIIDAVKARCISRFGKSAGSLYFRGLIATFPERHKDLFPEIYDPETGLMHGEVLDSVANP